MKKVLASLVISLSFFANLFALDFAFRITPNITIPQEDNLESGFGGFLNADLDLFNFITVGVEGGYTSVKQKSIGKNFNTFLGGASAGLYYYPLSRLYLSANGSYGIHSTKIDSSSVSGSSGSGTYWRTFGELGFRFTPALVLSAVGGYESFNIEGSSLFSTPFVGLSAKLNVSTNRKTTSDNFWVSFDQDSELYPVYASMYKQVPQSSSRNSE